MNYDNIDLKGLLPHEKEQVIALIEKFKTNNIKALNSLDDTNIILTDSQKNIKNKFEKAYILFEGSKSVTLYQAKKSLGMSLTERNINISDVEKRLLIPLKKTQLQSKSVQRIIHVLNKLYSEGILAKPADRLYDMN